MRLGNENVYTSIHFTPSPLPSAIKLNYLDDFS